MTNFEVVRKRSKIKKPLMIISLVLLFMQPFANVYAQGSVNVSASNFQSFITTKDKVFSFGNGELGLGDKLNNSQVKSPVEIAELNSKNIVLVSSGINFSVALSSDGKVYVWGNNKYRQLCDENYMKNNPYPEEIKFLADKGIKSISASDNHVLALSKDGKVYTWGSSQYGQRGITSLKDSSIPTEIKLLSDKNIIEIATGKNHCLALSSAGIVYSWGRDNCGQLGLSLQNGKRLYEGDIIANRSVLIPIEIKSISDKGVSHIFAGGDTSFAICKDGAVYAWGDHKYGQLGLDIDLDSAIEKVSKIVFYEINHTFYLNKETISEFANADYTFKDITGFNEPQLIKWFKDKKILTISASEKSSLFLTEDGKLYACGTILDVKPNGQMTTKQYIPRELKCFEDKKVVKIANGRTYSLAVTEDGQMYVWGYYFNNKDYTEVKKIFEYKEEPIILVNEHDNNLNNHQIQKENSGEIKIIINGNLINMDTPPIIIEDRTLVPIRAIFEALEIKVDWEDTTQTVTGTKGDTIIKLQINNKKAYINEKESELEVSAMMIANRTMVPIRFISESIGATVVFDEATNTIEITK